MIYLDYSATTPVNEEVLDTFIKINKEFIGNANSNHELGHNANKLVLNATNQIKELLNINDYDVIYTSSATESNNLVVKGICYKYNNRGKHIITTNFEHSSIYGPLEFLKNEGYEISYVKHDSNGKVDIEDLKRLLRKDTILVSINAINSEIGIKQDINNIGKIIKDNSKAFYHVDLTQAIGKINVDLNNIDLASFSAHKIYGLKGIACLLKKNNISLEPLFHGGNSSTIYRSGTPAHPLIASLSKSLRLSLIDIDKKYEYVLELNNKIKDALKKYKDVYINSNEYSIPHILNISIKGVKAESFMHALEEYDIYVSTKSACSDKDSLSESILSLTNNENLAKSSIRISLSHITTDNEIDLFLEAFDKCYKRFK